MATVKFWERRRFGTPNLPAKAYVPVWVGTCAIIGAAPVQQSSEYTPDGTCDHILGTVLKINSTGGSSLYISGIAIIHFLFQCKHLLHVRHDEDTKSGPKTSFKDGKVIILHTFLT